uniref:C3/C5 convertase n=1 Tax=Lepisosteus oculatus TaxID=7918 RepID=W5MHP3_LEPOC
YALLMSAMMNTHVFPHLFKGCLVSSGKTEEAPEGEDDDVEAKGCPQAEAIEGGRVSYSQGGSVGSELTYHCDEGWYPYPVRQRVCDAEGAWSTMRLPSGRSTTRAICKEVQCPAQLQLDNGVFSPRKLWFRPGESQQFWCQEGFKLYGSEVRNCTSGGDWTGSTPVCDDRVEDCVNPGAPPGSLRSGSRFRVGETVQYRCHQGLELLGSSDRVCLSARVWSGSEPRCLALFSFDSPAVVATALGASLSAVMDLSYIQDKKGTGSFGRTIRIEDDGKLNVYILLDTSGSINPKYFDEAKDAVLTLIRKKLDSYEVEQKYEVISYASQAKEIVSILDPESNNVEYVIDKLYEFKYTAHGDKTGTNLHAALNMVYRNMGFLKENKGSKFNQTRHVILIVSDGHSNTGGSPKSVLNKIRSLLGIHMPSLDNTNEDYLDIYVFGVGDKVNKRELNSIASQKRDEEHLFILKGPEELGKVFDQMISDSAVTMCGVAQESEAQLEELKVGYVNPWHVEVKTVSIEKKENCRGTILTQSWILTAAHCFTQDMVEEPKKVSILFNGATSTSDVATAIVLHPQYDIQGLLHKKVKEFYDYDVALVKVKNKIGFSERSRPVCLPCTVPSARALKIKANSTCDEHLKALFRTEEIPANFLTKAEQLTEKKQVERKQTHIQYGSRKLQRPACIEKAKVALEPDSTADVSEFVTDRFLCTGGSSSYKDSIACKGDSGGALFVQQKRRYFQVCEN